MWIAASVLWSAAILVLFSDALKPGTPRFNQDEFDGFKAGNDQARLATDPRRLRAFQVGFRDGANYKMLPGSDPIREGATPVKPEFDPDEFGAYKDGLAAGVKQAELTPDPDRLDHFKVGFRMGAGKSAGIVAYYWPLLTNTSLWAIGPPILVLAFWFAVRWVFMGFVRGSDV